MIRTISKFMLVLAVVALLPQQVFAAKKMREEFPKVVEKEGRTLALRGTGVKTLIFMKAFSARLYLEDRTAAADVLSDVPKHLDVKYFTHIPGRVLTDYTVTRMKLNITRQEFADLKNEIDLMGKYFVDLKVNDHFSLTYIPGVGTQFAHNGTLTGVIPGEKFGRALFSVWLGNKPFDRNLKQKILGLS